MKINETKEGTYTLTGVTADQLEAMLIVLRTANESCFQEKFYDEYPSGENFMCVLNEKQRKGLADVCEVL